MSWILSLWLRLLAPGLATTTTAVSTTAQSPSCVTPSSWIPRSAWRAGSSHSPTFKPVRCAMPSRNFRKKYSSLRASHPAVLPHCRVSLTAPSTAGRSPLRRWISSGACPARAASSPTSWPMLSRLGRQQRNLRMARAGLRRQVRLAPVPPDRPRLRRAAHGPPADRPDTAHQPFPRRLGPGRLQGLRRCQVFRIRFLRKTRAGPLLEKSNAEDLAPKRQFVYPIAL